jgi:flagellar assembly protein FliH
MAGFIPKEDLAAYQRWQANSFDRKSSIKNIVEQPKSTTPEIGEGELVTTLGLPTAEDIEQINEAARDEGYQAGFEEGLQAAKSSRATAIADEMDRLAALIGNLQVSLAHMDQTIADQVLDLALEVASQVIRGSISVNSESLIPIIREAIAALPLHHSQIMLHLNPADAAMVREETGEQLKQIGVQIIDDTSMTPGGCLLRAGNSEIDAMLETRWKRVLEAIGTEPREWLSNP